MVRVASGAFVYFWESGYFEFETTQFSLYAEKVLTPPFEVDVKKKVSRAEEEIFAIGFQSVCTELAALCPYATSSQIFSRPALSLDQ